MYQIFELPHHSTSIKYSNANPEYNDEHVWTLPISVELDDYLRTAVIIAKQIIIIINTDCSIYCI